jgi:RND family efflux transporter MFP subunit
MNVGTRVLTSIAGVCAAWLVGCEKGERPALASKASAPARAVQVMHAEVRPMARSLAVTGTLSARERSTLSAKVSGRLQSLAVDIGSPVRKGDVLAQVEPRDYELRMQQAEAALAQARTSLGLPAEGDGDQIELQDVTTVKQAQAVLEEASKNLERVKNLSHLGISSQSELDTAEATFRVAQTRFETAREEARTRLAALAQRRAEFEIARKQLADTAVRAPFDGIIQARPANPGEHVAAGMAIVQLVKTDPLRLRLEVPERESAAVRTNQVVHLRVEGDTNIYTGSIARLSPALDEQSRVLLVEADVPTQGSLRPGLFARANIIIDEHEKAIGVPPNAIVTFAGLEKVVLAQGGKAQEKIVSTGRRTMEWVEIVSGLNGGEAVILNPGALHTGQPLSINEASHAENQKAAPLAKDLGQ